MTDDGNRPHRFSEGQGFDEDYSAFSLDPPELEVDPTKVDPVDSRVLTDLLDQRNIDPEDVDVEKLLDVGLSYMQINRFEEATEALERTARFAEDDSLLEQEAWVNKGAAHAQLEEWDEAIGSYQEALSLDEETEHGATAHTNLAYALWESGRTSDALHHAERAVELDPRFPQAWYNRGFFLHERGLNEDAVNAFDNAIRLGMRNATVLEEKARALEELGREDEAQQVQQQADEIRDRAEENLVEDY
ncbi:hypothetical protein C455_14792 [Haloferax larsenii JCM 13917]|nr:tetratricopeptide repeat protein [Haloferax larsenii]ELZ77064.1 hypothetical protein C455_14792 [Haloferax larsenii JCM 13917]